VLLWHKCELIVNLELNALGIEVHEIAVVFVLLFLKNNYPVRIKYLSKLRIESVFSILFMFVHNLIVCFGNNSAPY
jgi:hypothetical protein